MVFLIPAMLLGFMTTAQYDYTQFRYADVDVRGLSMNPDADFGKKIAFVLLIFLRKIQTKMLQTISDSNHSYDVVIPKAVEFEQLLAQ